VYVNIHYSHTYCNSVVTLLHSGNVVGVTYRADRFYYIVTQSTDVDIANASAMSIADACS